MFIGHRSSSRLILTVALGLGIAILSSCRQDTPFGIVFASNRDGNFELYRMTSDGGEVERLTYTAGYDEQVAIVSPDGNRISFDRGGSRLERDIYLLNLETDKIAQLTDAAAYDLAGAWSPDGSQLAFISDRDGGTYRLYLMNQDGSGQQLVPFALDPEHGVAGSLDWSPDGRYLAYVVTNHLHASTVLTPTVYIVDLTTLDTTPLTDQRRHGACVHPDWSPDGSWITLVCTKGTAANDYGDVYVIRPDGTDFTRVTTRPASHSPNFPANTLLTWVLQPRWSPDGRQIVYAARVDGPWSIYIIEADGEPGSRLTDVDAVDWSPSTYRLP